MTASLAIGLSVWVIVGVCASMWVAGFWLGREFRPRRGTTLTREEFEEFERQILWRIRERIDAVGADQSALHSRAIGQATRVIMAKLATLERTMDVKLDELLDAVAAQQTKIDSLVTLTGELHKRVLEAMGDTITPSQAMRIAQVFDAVKANSDEIDAAITANTDAQVQQDAAGAVSQGASAGEIKSQVGNVTQVPSTEQVDLPGGTQ